MTSETLDTLPRVVFETAAEHLTSRVPIAAPTARADEIRRSLRGRTFDTVAEIAICEDGKLVGLLNVEDVLAAPEDTPAHEIMDADPPWSPRVWTRRSQPGRRSSMARAAWR